MLDILSAVIMVAVLVFMLAVAVPHGIRAQNECRARGGSLVESGWGSACVQVLPLPPRL